MRGVDDSEVWWGFAPVTVEDPIKDTVVLASGGQPTLQQVPPVLRRVIVWEPTGVPAPKAVDSRARIPTEVCWFLTCEPPKRICVRVSWAAYRRAMGEQRQLRIADVLPGQ